MLICGRDRGWDLWNPLSLKAGYGVCPSVSHLATSNSYPTAPALQPQHAQVNAFKLDGSFQFMLCNTVQTDVESSVYVRLE